MGGIMVAVGGGWRRGYGEERSDGLSTSSSRR